jgi:hypothetical protein
MNNLSQAFHEEPERIGSVFTAFPIGSNAIFNCESLLQLGDA